MIRIASLASLSAHITPVRILCGILLGIFCGAAITAGLGAMLVGVPPDDLGLDVKPRAMFVTPDDSAIHTAAAIVPPTDVAVTTEVIHPSVPRAPTDPDDTVSADVSPASEPARNRVNINVASTAVLAHKLKGIGPSKAEAIVRYRESNGAFQSVDDLVNVKGIGPKTLEKLRDSIVAGKFVAPPVGESLAEQEIAAKRAVQSVVKRSLEIRKAVTAQ